MTTKIFWLKATKKGLELPCRMVGLLSLAEGMEVFYSETDSELYFWTKEAVNYKRSKKVCKMKMKRRRLPIPYRILKKYVHSFTNGEYLPCVIGQFDFARVIHAEPVCNVCKKWEPGLSVTDSTILCPKYRETYLKYHADDADDYAHPVLRDNIKKLLREFQNKDENFRGYVQIIESNILDYQSAGHDIVGMRDAIWNLLITTVSLTQRKENDERTN